MDKSWPQIYFPKDGRCRVRFPGHFCDVIFTQLSAALDLVLWVYGWVGTGYWWLLSTPCKITLVQSRAQTLDIFTLYWYKWTKIVSPSTYWATLLCLESDLHLCQSFPGIHNENESGLISLSLTGSWRAPVSWTSTISTICFVKSSQIFFVFQFSCSPTHSY